MFYFIFVDGIQWNSDKKMVIFTCYFGDKNLKTCGGIHWNTGFLVTKKNPVSMKPTHRFQVLNPKFHVKSSLFCPSFTATQHMVIFHRIWHFFMYWNLWKKIKPFKIACNHQMSKVVSCKKNWNNFENILVSQKLTFFGSASCNRNLMRQKLASLKN